ncbi:hypothetical protein ACOSQ3_006590 [Xanthoceras sorbifolium]
MKKGSNIRSFGELGGNSIIYGEAPAYEVERVERQMEAKKHSVGNGHEKNYKSDGSCSKAERTGASKMGDNRFNIMSEDMGDEMVTGEGQLEPVTQKNTVGNMDLKDISNIMVGVFSKEASRSKKSNLKGSKDSSIKMKALEFVKKDCNDHYTCLPSLSPILSTEKLSGLNDNVNYEEVKEGLFSIGSLKALEPRDGHSSRITGFGSPMR